jgi:hypothetical protein
VVAFPPRSLVQPSSVELPSVGYPSRVVKKTNGTKPWITANGEIPLMQLGASEVRSNLAVFVQAPLLQQNAGTLIRAIGSVDGVQAEVARGRVSLLGLEPQVNQATAPIYGSCVLRGRVPPCDSIRITALADASYGNASTSGANTTITAIAWDGPNDDRDSDPFCVNFVLADANTLVTQTSTDLIEAAWTNESGGNAYMWVCYNLPGTGIHSAQGPFLVAAGETFDWEPARPLRMPYGVIFSLSTSSTLLVGNLPWSGTVLFR